MAEIVSTIATTMFDHSLGVIGRQFGYLWNYKKNVDDLKVQIEKLDIARRDNGHRVTVAKNNAERIRDGVKSWQSDADQISEEAREILQAYEEKGKKRCFMDLSPSLVSRYRFGRRACKKGMEVQQVITKADQIQEVSDRAGGEGIQNALSTERLLTFDSRSSTLEDIIKALQDETNNTIGVYGLGGIGKTTLAKQVLSRAAEEKMFEEFVMGSVTQTVDMKEVQGKIASTLSMSLSETSVAERACRIRERLKGKKVLIILDDLWKEIDLKEVGIPHGVGHKGCKMLLTSRTRDVLSSMDTDREFLLGALTEEEAWRLFEEKTVDAIRKPNFLPVGKEVAKRCAGLPVLIVTVAASLARQQDLKVWKDAVTKLTKMNNRQMHDIVNSAIKTISYNHLEASHKQLFLLIGLLGGDASIEQLLHYSLGWDLFNGEVARVEDARNSLHTMIRDLMGSCLLLDGDSQRERNSVRMHDVVRDVAISIAEKDSNLFLIRKNDVELNSWHKDASLERCGAMVLRGCRSFPQLLECPSLKLLFLNQDYNSSSPSIPDNVFEKTTKLKVLDMSGLNFSALPSSLSFLKNLQTLRLERCYKLIDISQVGELKKLQILSFANSRIQELPSGIGQLSELRLLDLSGCSELKVIPAGLIAGLSRLEELKMTRGFDRWDAGEYLNSSGRSNASLVELKHLTHLTTLEIAVSNAKLLSEDLDFEKWEKYEIIVGDMWDSWDFRDWFDQLEMTRKFCLQHSTTSINHLKYGVKRLFKGTECLCLGELKDIKNVTPTLDGDGFLELKHLRIQKVDEIQYIVNAEDRQQVSFPSLESLYLSHLMNLQQLCNGQLMEESFTKLTTVTVIDCNKLESLFYFSMATRLQCLKEIKVFNCAALEDIVAEKGRDYVDVNTTDEVCKKIVFAQLRKLSLQSLPKLNNFFSNQKSLITNVESEEIISEEADIKSSMPFFEKVSFPELEELLLAEMSNLWSHKLQEMPCCNLTRLTVKNCDKLTYLFTSSMITVLVKLQELTIRDCAGMKQVVAKEEGETEKGTIIFPQLSYLTLESLSNLTTFYQGIEEADWNENLEALFNEKVQFPSLKTLDIYDLDSVKAIWPNTMEKTQSWKKGIPTFQNLQQCVVIRCKGLRHVFPAYVARSLNQLEELGIHDCGVEMIISYGDTELGEIKAGEMATTTDMIVFPQLTHLWLEDLPNLTTFYSGVEEMNSNDKLDSHAQPLFSEQVQFPRLEELKIIGMDSIDTIWQEQLLYEVDSFSKLKHVRVTHCESLKCVFSESVARSLNQLEELTVKDCGVETIIGDTELEERKVGTTFTFTFPKLISINLKRLPSLKCIYPREHTIELPPAMKNLNVVGCHQVSVLDILSHLQKQVSFPELEELQLSKMPDLKYLFTSSMITVLVRLQVLRIEDCAGMKQVVAKEEGETEKGTIIFPQLSHLIFFSLSNLTTFYQGIEEVDWNENLEALFNEKVQFPGLKTLCITKLDSVKAIWPNTMEKTQSWKKGIPTFQNLQQCVVSGCKGLRHVFPAYVARSLNKLEALSIEDCGVETIISYGDTELGEIKAGEMATTTDMIVFPQLTHLSLQHLPNLTTFYSGVEEMNSNDKLDSDAQPLFSEQIRFPRLEKLEIIGMDSIDTIWQEQLLYAVDSFSKLKQVTVTRCESLKCVLSDSRARSLNQLEELTVEDCGVETIIGDNENAELEDRKVGATFTFPILISINLRRLPSLKCIYPREHTIELPAMRNLNVVGCHQVSVLDILSHLQKQVFPRLEYLSIRGKEDMMKILSLWDLSPQHLHLTSLTITEFKVAFPSKFLTIIHHQLQSFEIRNCTFQEILPYQEEVIDHLFLPQLRRLKLEKLPELTYICNQYQHLSFVPRIIDRLTSLCVNECPRLTNLVPPFVSFNSLQILYVIDCGGLINLMQPSTARSLQKLKVLYIRGCGIMEEIIGGEVGGGDEESSRDDEIIFSELKYLILGKLPRLTSFCSSQNYNFNFPSLDNVYVKECPNMKTFCGGIATTPELREVGTESGTYWEGGLNTTIAKMEATRLATANPSILPSKHFEVEAQTQVNETIMEGENATDQEKVAGLCEKGKGKEVEEHFEKSEEMTRHSYPSCSSWTANSPGEASPSFASAAEGDVQKTLATAVPTISPRNQIEEKVQFHDKPAGVLAEEMICKNGVVHELVNQDQVCEEALQGGNEVGNVVTQLVKPADTCCKVEEQIIVRPIASQQNDFEDLHVTKHFIPLMTKVLEILQTRPLNSMSARHVQFMEDACRDLSAMNFPVEWLIPYVEKAKKWLSVVERAKAISEVELKIAQVEAQLQTLKKTKKALQEENKIIGSNVDLDKPLYEE